MTRPSERRAQVPLALLRHGPTDWNALGRTQGRADRPLSPAGRTRVRAWRLPDDLAAYRWVSSPLRRARETAALLGHPDAVVEAALVEADWGDWEGRSLAELRAELGEAMVRMEARGLDFRPPGGESPRDLQARLTPWLRRVAGAGRPTAAVCHKGVIRALYALATGWDLQGRPPETLKEDRVHHFLLDAEGGLVAERINRPLLP